VAQENGEKIGRSRQKIKHLFENLGDFIVQKIKPLRTRRIHKGYGEKFSDRKRNCE